MKCPMCEAEELVHINKHGTHIYSCPICPFIGMEFYTKDDLDMLAHHLGEDYSMKYNSLRNTSLGLILRLQNICNDKKSDQEKMQEVETLAHIYHQAFSKKK